MTTVFTIGHELESGVCREPTSSLGEITGEPLQLLSWLESQLGLQLPDISFTARMVPYLNCLRDRDDGSRFYSQSLEKDEFGVAGELLRWRDTWYEAGWDGSGFSEAYSKRLLDMAAVEELAGATVPLGLGQRVQRVLQALDFVDLAARVTLVDPPEVFPKVWQQLFGRLGAVVELYTPEPQCDDESDLAVLQRALIGADWAGDPTPLEGDATVLVLRDGSPQLSAAWIARYAHSQLSEGGDVAILAGEEGATLDEALTAAGFPRLGFSTTSYWRPAFQVLPLAFELLWRPLDPGVLLQFLTHPMGPIPRAVRRRLASRVAREPGIGGSGWQQTLTEALEKTPESVDQSKAARSRDDIAERIDFWLNSKRYAVEEGAPVESLRSRVRAVSRWLNDARNAEEEAGIRDVYTAALGHAEDLDRTLELLGETGTTMLTREGIRRLVEAVRGSGSARPGRQRQCEASAKIVLRAGTPAAFLEPVSQVVWWGCDSVTLPRQYPWSRVECESLSANGVELVPIATQLEWQATSWLRPPAATERVLIVLHDNVEGHHPVFDQISAAVKGWTEERIDRLLRDPDRVPIGSTLPPTQTITQAGLPPKQRWWQLPGGVAIGKRDQESFSSLERFLYSPYRWVLDYQARISPGALEELSDGPLLLGNLTHELFEDFFNTHTNVADIDPEAADAWVRAEAPRLIEQKGAVLAMPGRQADAEDFISTAANALRALLERLQQAGVTAVQMETELQGRFGGGKVRGTVDLIANKASGETAVIDLKWGRFNDRQKMLRDGNYLQLGVYAHLVQQKRGQWPTLAYFIISDAQLIVLDSDFFPGVMSEQPVSGETVVEFWQRVEATWKWRREQLDNGFIEVSVTGTEPDEFSDPGEHGLPIPETDDQYDDYTFLTGWGEKQ